MSKKKTPGDKDERVVTIDVDDTLLMWPKNEHMASEETITVLDPISGDEKFLIPHHAHIRLLKHFSDRGYYIIVWSAGGGRWAQRVVDTLKLNEYVDHVMCKPLKYIDDHKADQWMTHLYIPYGKQQ